MSKATKQITTITATVTEVRRSFTEVYTDFDARYVYHTWNQHTLRLSFEYLAYTPEPKVIQKLIRFRRYAKRYQGGRR